MSSGLRNHLKVIIFFAFGSLKLMAMEETHPAFKGGGYKPAQGELFEKITSHVHVNMLKKGSMVFRGPEPVINPNKITELSLIKEWTPDLVYDQGPLSSCTANAICSVVRYLSAAQSSAHSLRIKDASGNYILNPEMLHPSRLYQYYNTRWYESALEGYTFNPLNDWGASIGGSVLALDRFGCCPENIFLTEETINLYDLQGTFKYAGWPYKIDRYGKQPDPESYRLAFDHSSDGLNEGTPYATAGKPINPYAAVSQRVQYKDLASSFRKSSTKILNTEAEKETFRNRILQSLQNDRPVVVGVMLDGTYHKASRGYVPTPVLSTFEAIGGHALTMVGFGPYNPQNPSKRYGRFLNSYGTKSGLNGYCYLEEDYILNVNRFSIEAYSIWFNK